MVNLKKVAALTLLASMIGLKNSYAMEDEKTHGSPHIRQSSHNQQDEEEKGNALGNLGISQVSTTPEESAEDLEKKLKIINLRLEIAKKEAELKALGQHPETTPAQPVVQPSAPQEPKEELKPTQTPPSKVSQTPQAEEKHKHTVGENIGRETAKAIITIKDTSDKAADTVKAVTKDVSKGFKKALKKHKKEKKKKK